MTRIAVTGATGHLGRLAIEKLKARLPAESLVALARRPAAAADLGVAVREADYNRPETLTPALAGVERLLLISGSEMGARLPQHQAVIDAAKAAGVGFLAYTSLLHADRSAIHALADEHLATEAALARSGIPFTLLRNGWYTENHEASVRAAVEHGVLLGAAGDARISGAARADYAEAAAIVLTAAGHEGKTYELAGDEAYSLADLAAEVSRQAGRTIPYKNLDEAEYAKVLESAGMPAAVARVYAAFDAGIAQGSVFDDSRTLSKLLGRPTTPLSAAVAAALKG